MESSRIPIAVIDDHEMVRAGLAGMLERMGGYHVVCEAANGRDLMDKIGPGNKPRIAVVDLHMPVMDGFETLLWLRENHPDILPLALTFDPAEDMMVKALRAGARGFLRKNARAAVLKTALDSLIVSGYYHSDEMHEVILQKNGLRTGYEREQERILETLSEREMEFLTLVCSPEEHTYESIAKLMQVHRRTVDGYKESLMEKFQIRSKTGLVLFALKWGIIKP